MIILMFYGKKYQITNKLRRNFYIEKVIDLKSKRHNQILDIINNNDIETQEELAEELKKCGFDVTQATVSRDIKILK